jgi:hypothetical protein
MTCSGRFKKHIEKRLNNFLDRTVGLLKRFSGRKSQQRKEEECVGYEVFPFKYLASQPKGKLR